MLWRYYFQVLLSGTLLNLYSYTGLFEKTGAALQAKHIYLHKMETKTLGERLDQTFRMLDNSLHRDNSIELHVERRPDVDGGYQPSSLQLNITHATVDSDAGSRIKNYTTHETERPHSQPPSHKHSTLYFEKYAGECVLAFGHTTVSLLSRLLAPRHT